jgi:hypothetical protein
MTLVYVARSVGLTLWVDMEHYSSNIPPMRTLVIRLQKAEIRDNMPFVICGRTRFV